LQFIYSSQAPHLEKFSDVARIELWREPSAGDGGVEASNWYCEKVIVNDRKEEKCYFFPVQRWVRSGVRIMIELNDTFLPQFDPNKAQRDKEQEILQGIYTYGQSAPDLPVQVRWYPSTLKTKNDKKFNIFYNNYE